ncbi:MFS transporter [[Eubacterium] cellulosolvens]
MKKIVLAIGISHLLTEVYFLMHLVLIPVFLEEFNLGLFEVSFIVTVPTAIGLVMNFFSGFTVDRIGAKPILLLGMAVQGFGGLVVAESWTVITLIFGLTCISVASSFYHNSGLSTISGSLMPNKLSKAMGLHNAMGAGGASLGLLTLTLALTYGDWRSAYIIWIIPTWIWCLFLMRTRHLPYYEKHEKDHRPSKSILTKDFVSFLSSMGIRQAGITVILTFMTTYMVFIKGFTETTSSFIFTLGPPIGILSSLFAGYLGFMLGDKKVLMLVILGAAGTVILMPFTSTTIFLIIVFLCFAFFKDSVWAPISSITAKLTPSNRRGLAYSLSMSTQQSIIAFTPPIAAKFIEGTSLNAMFPLSFSLLIISTIILNFSSKKYN